MPFDYLHSTIPQNYLNAPEKAEKMYLEELEEKASLLYRLYYSKEEVLKRLKGNLKWDWECNPKPDYVSVLEKKITEIVEKVFSGKPGVSKKVINNEIKDKPVTPTTIVQPNQNTEEKNNS